MYISDKRNSQMRHKRRAAMSWMNGFAEVTGSAGLRGRDERRRTDETSTRGGVQGTGNGNRRT